MHLVVLLENFRRGVVFLELMLFWAIPFLLSDNISNLEHIDYQLELMCMSVLYFVVLGYCNSVLISYHLMMFVVN